MKWIVRGYPYCLKTTSPATTDTGYQLNFIWVNITSGVAYILDSLAGGVASWPVKTPDSVINGDINVIGATTTGDLIIWTPGTAVTDPDAIHSHPGSGEYKVSTIRMDADEKVVITYENTPQP